MPTRSATTAAWLPLAPLLACAPALGQLAAPEQPAGLEEAAALPQYQIEVIAFAYNAFEPTEEDFHARRERDRLAQAGPAPRTPGAVELDALEAPAGQAALPGAPPLAQGEAASREADSGAANEPWDPLQEPERAPQRAFRFRILDPEELELSDEYATLERLDAYTPLLHAGWVQEGLPPEQARPFDLSLLGALNPAGTIQLHVSRFLHLSIDVGYQAGGPGGPGQSFVGPSGFGLSELSMAPRYVLRTQRRARSGELHYFDHPAFGLLVIVRPQPVEEPATPDQVPSPAA